MADNFSEAQEFGHAEPGPFSKREVNDKGEKNNPGVVEDKGNQRCPAYEEVTGHRNDQCFDGEDEGDTTAFFNLGGYEFFRKRDHDKEWEDRNSGQPCALKHSSYDENAQDGERHDRDGHGDAREVEQTKLFHEETRQCPDGDDTHKDSDAVLQSVGIKSKERKSDDGWGVNTKGLDTDYLAKKSHHRDDDREHEEECHCLEGHTLLDDEIDERVVLHIF